MTLADVLLINYYKVDFIILYLRSPQDNSKLSIAFDAVLNSCIRKAEKWADFNRERIPEGRGFRC